MTTTPPDRVRAGLRLVAESAAADTRAVAESASTGADARAALFLAAPLILSDYTDGASALALEWYEELRDAARVERPFAPAPVTLVTDENVRAIVAMTTLALVESPTPTPVDVAVAPLELLGDRIQELVADAFRDTITENVAADPAAAGWRRFARPEACKFCKMLAAKGAVFTERTARFAAHGATMNGGRKGGNCMCIAGPEFGGPTEWTEATPMQYVASKRKRSAKERAALRDYLNENFSDGDSAPTSSKRKRPERRESPTPLGFDSLTIEQLENQIRVLEGVKDSAYKTEQLARLRKRLAALR